MSFEPSGNKIEQRCIHCDETVGKGIKYCKFCSTAESRRNADAENMKINQKFVCKLC